MPNPYVILAVVLMWIASLAGVGYWQNEVGRTSELAKWEEQKNAEIDAANQALYDTEEKYRAAEKQHADMLATVSTTYEGRIKDEQAKTAKLIAAANAGTYRLRDPNATPINTIGHNVPEAATGTGRCDGTGDGGLSTITTRNLLSLTGRCNYVSAKLSACQAIVKADRQ